MPKREPHRKELTPPYIWNTKEPMTWDTKQLGLCLRVRPSGTKTFYVVYQHDGRPRWYRLGRYGAIGIKEARRETPGR